MSTPSRHSEKLLATVERTDAEVADTDAVLVELKAATTGGRITSVGLGDGGFGEDLGDGEPAVSYVDSAVDTLFNWPDLLPTRLSPFQRSIVVQAVGDEEVLSVHNANYNELFSRYSTHIFCAVLFVAGSAVGVLIFSDIMSTAVFYVLLVCRSVDFLFCFRLWVTPSFVQVLDICQTILASYVGIHHLKILRSRIDVVASVHLFSFRWQGCCWKYHKMDKIPVGQAVHPGAYILFDHTTNGFGWDCSLKDFWLPRKVVYTDDLLKLQDNMTHLLPPGASHQEKNTKIIAFRVVDLTCRYIVLTVKGFPHREDKICVLDVFHRHK